MAKTTLQKFDCMFVLQFPTDSANKYSIFQKFLLDTPLTQLNYRFPLSYQLVVSIAITFTVIRASIAISSHQLEITRSLFRISNLFFLRISCISLALSLPFLSILLFDPIAVYRRGEMYPSHSHNKFTICLLQV